ncbi:Receptor-type guanylate cyclase gcy-28, partial [Bulinus truncatus]
FFYDIEETMGDLFGETFTKAFKSTTEYIWSGYKLSGKTDTRAMFRIWLMDAASRSRGVLGKGAWFSENGRGPVGSRRFSGGSPDSEEVLKVWVHWWVTQLILVFIMCLTGPVLGNFMLEAHSLGYGTSAEFVFVIMINIVTEATDDNTWLLGNGTEEQQMLKESFAQALFMHIDITQLNLPASFADEMRRRSLVYYGYNYSNDEPTITLSQYYDAVRMYATVLNESISEGGNPYDGLDITRRLWNRTFSGLIGPVTVNKDGDRYSDVTITALNPEVGKFQTYAVYDSQRRTLTFSKSASSFPWPLNNGVSPGDEPACGYTGVLCSYTEKSQVIGGLAGFFGVAVAVGGFVSLIMFRRWKKQSERDLWWWKIDPTDVFITDRKFTHSIWSFTSKINLSGSRADHEDVGASYGLLAVFRGQLVRLRPIPIRHLKKTTDQLLTEFKLYFIERYVIWFPTDERFVPQQSAQDVWCMSGREHTRFGGRALHETASNVMPLYQIIDNETEIELPGSSKPKDLYVGQSVDVLEDTQLQTNSPFKKRRTNENSNKSSVESVVNYFENRHKKSADKDDLLFSSYAQTLKTFTPERQSSLKLEMAELFAKHERLHIKEKEKAQ